MEYCDACGGMLDPGAEACPACGKTVEDTTQPSSLTLEKGPVESAAPPLAADAASSDPQPKSISNPPPPIEDTDIPPQPNAPNQPPPPYGQPVYPNPPQIYGYAPPPPPADVMRIWDYLWPYLLNFIPCVGGIVWLVMMLVWGFGSYGPNRKNFARANLIIALVGIVLTILIWLFVVVVLGISMSEIFSDAYYYSYY